MVSRRKLREKASSVKESVAGTISDKKQQLKQKVKNRRKRKELENFRDQEVTDQGQARLQRAKKQAQQKARQEARQEFIEEYRDEVRDELREEELQRLRRENNVGQNQQQGGGFGALLGEPREPAEQGEPREQRPEPAGATIPAMGPPPGDEAGGPIVPGMGPPPGEQQEMGGPQIPPLFGEEPDGRDDEPRDFPFPY